MIAAATPADPSTHRRPRRWLQPAAWLVGVLLFGAIGVSAVGALIESITLTFASENVRATVAAGVAVVLYVVAAIAWMTGIGFIARWRGARWVLTIGLGAAIVTRLILAVAIQGPLAAGGAASVNGEAAAVFAEAVRIAERGLAASDWAIGHPAVLGGLFALVGEQRWVEAALDIVASLSIGLVMFDLLRRAGGLEVAAAGIGLFAIMPSQALLVPAFGPDLAYAALILGAVWLLVAIPFEPQRVRGRLTPPGVWSTACAAGAGVLLGLSHLLRPTSLALLPAFAILALVLLRDSHPRRAAAALSIAFCAVLLPVVVTNAAHHQALSFEPTSHAGWRLFVGTDPTLGGGIGEIDAAGLDRFRGTTTRAKSDSAGAEALDRVLADPMAFAELVGPKFTRAWGDDAYGAQLALEPAAARGGLLLAFEVASRVAWAFVALAAAWGIARSWPLSGVLLAAVLVVASLAVLHTFVATEARDHAVVVPLFIVAAAAGLRGPLARRDAVSRPVAAGGLAAGPASDR